MKLPNFRRLYSSDFEADKKDLIDRLGTSLNVGIETLYDALNKKLNFRDNISSTFAEFTVTVDSNGTPTRATSFKLDSSQTSVEGLIVVNAGGATDATLYPTGGVFVSFTKSEGIIIIKNIKGLEPNKAYSVKVLMLG